VPSAEGTEPVVWLSGVLPRSLSEVIRYCGVWATTLYCVPSSGRSKRGARLEAPGKRDEQVGSDVLLREPEKFGLGPVHIDIDLRIVIRLLNVQVYGARDPRQLLQQLLDERAVRLDVGAVTCTSSGEGRPKFNIWLTMSAGRNWN